LNKLNQFKKNFRTAQTDAEKFLWFHLRSCRLGNYKFRRQHPIKHFIVDFVCLEKKLIIELDGGQHIERKEYDDARSNQLRQYGYQVLRFWNHDVLNDGQDVLVAIYEALTR